jgi:prepilin-type N-terminal cleavage/methylation domain-containing protein
MHSAIQERRRRFGGQGGFTLFEVIMVLLILGIISYFAAARLFDADAPTQSAEMELVKNHLRYAQSRTMNTEKDWGITFETGGKSYFLFNEDNVVLPIRLPGDESSIGKMTLPTVTVTNAPITVRFLSDQYGSPGIATISITTTAGTITVTKNTGFIP